MFLLCPGYRGLLHKPCVLPLLPRRGPDFAFSECDVARAQLILDLKREMGVNDEGIGIILSLVDQMHGLRRVLRELMQASQEAGMPHS
jgi:chaperone modulatory protein CbpM